MAFNFSDEDKEVREFQESLPFGVSVVQVTGAIADQNDNGKEFIEVGVVNEAGVEDSVKLWFTGGASNISFNTLRQIAVHCSDDEEAKAAARDRIDAVKDSQELADAISEICSGKQIWYTKYYDAQGRTYTNGYGTFKSINENIYSYEPKLKPELMPKPADENGEEITKDNVDKVFPGAEKVDGSKTVPDNWS